MNRVVPAVCILLCLPLVINAQKKPAGATSSLCTRDNALDTTKQQILQTRTFDNQVHRIAVLIRAADLLWPHEPDKALATFMEAFDLAVQNFKESGDVVNRTSKSQFAAVIPQPDQRFKVLAALAKRDPARARKLSDKMLQDDAKDAADKPAADDQTKMRAAEKILTLARGLVPDDVPSAINFARQSFRYSATLNLPAFIYHVAKTNRQAADQFYVEALSAYNATPMDQFLYLSSYPFGNTRDAGDMPAYTNYTVPEGYVPSAALQRQFMQILLSRSEAALATTVEPTSSNRYPDHAQMWLALTRLEKQVQENLPDLAESTARTKERLFASLNQGTQQSVTREILADNPPKRSFDEQVEAAEKQKDVGRRDQLLTFAVTGASKDVPLEKVLSVIDKISEAGIRDPLLNWFYYFSAQSLIASKELGEARKYAARVTELDQRAYLFTRIAEESLKQTEDQAEARDLLNEISNDIGKAPKTIVTARALLALAHLYAKIDMNRGIEELGNAVKTINALESPDFSQQFVIMKIEGKTFGSFASFSTPGFNPENAFREMGKLDFDGSLIQATTFTDKSLRALTTLAVIEPCFVTKTRKKT
ncbi:MAG TPA: hypothetical protein VJR02_27700 [Pyrinomonadaceae bacterium]|nr:hypothetical protein [Pyrinomonadaceae bacterium]